MKAFFTCLAVPGLAFAAAAAAAPSEDPRIAGAFVELRKAPVFTAPALSLAKTWGPALPMGSSFQVEKVYGRWIYGRPAPLPYMKAADYAPSGWVFSRFLALPGDADTLAPPVAKLSRAVLFHARAARARLGSGDESLDFLESLVLSRNTLGAFSQPGPAASLRLPPLVPAAFAAAEEPAPVGLIGTELSFLDQEVKVVQQRKKKEAKARESKKLRPPPLPALDDRARTGVLGRTMLERYLEIPALSMEEVDGHIYMRATAWRALEGCPAKVKAFWKDRRWAFFRVFRLKSRPEVKHPWLEIALPGGYFGVSGKAIEEATNEAELAFLLVRQLVRELRVKRRIPKLAGKGWPGNLPAAAEEVWDQTLREQSTKDSQDLDVADEIAVDTQAIECIAHAGYRPMAGVAYLRKLALHREEPWAKWYAQHAIGLDYRIERVTAITQESIAQQRIPDGKDAQEKRFASASKQWNLLP